MACAAGAVGIARGSWHDAERMVRSVLPSSALAALLSALPSTLPSTLPFVLAPAAPLAAQDARPQAGPRALQPIDMFRLEYFLHLQGLQPKGWLDADRLLVFTGQPGGPQHWYAVDVRSKKRSPLLPRQRVEQELVAAGAKPDALAALNDDDHWIWNADHTRCVLDVGLDLFVCGLDGAVHRLTETPEQAEEIVQWSPDGARVGFVRGNDLFVVPADGGKEIAITTGGGPERFFGKLDWVYQEEVFGRGDFRAYWWSPDGTRLAFFELDESPVQEFTLVSDTPARPEIEVVNYPKAGEPNPIVWLRTASVTGGESTKFDVARYPDEDRLIVRVQWAPDGKEVFFQVQDRAQTRLDMLAGDPATGQVRVVFREASDCWIEPGQDAWWLAGGAQFVWPSERDGYRHLYRYRRDGTLLGPLTKGEWQVEEVLAVDEAAGVIWFEGDKASPLQTHLFHVGIETGEVVQVTQGRGTHDVTLAPGFATFVSVWSSAEQPPVTRVYDRAGKELAVLAEPDPRVLAPFALTPPEFVQVPARDGYAMDAMLIKPRDFDPAKRYPVVQLTYAGPHTPRVQDEWGGRDLLWHHYLAQHGYVGFVCDNRSASGKGRTFAKACWRRLGSSELQDLEDAAKWIAAQGIADPQRIAIWGWSYGGYQTLYNLTHSTLWACGVAVNPVTDWRNYDTIYTERYLGTPQDNPEGYERSSVVAAAGNLHGELLLIAAAMDDNVHMQNSLQFLHAMQLAGKDCEFMVYPRVRHGIESLEQQLHLFGKFERFLKKHL